MVLLQMSTSIVVSGRMIRFILGQAFMVVRLYLVQLLCIVEGCSWNQGF